MVVGLKKVEVSDNVGGIFSNFVHKLDFLLEVFKVIVVFFENCQKIVKSVLSALGMILMTTYSLERLLYPT
jgi:hypothetical protein